MEGHLLMSAKERRRKSVFERVSSGSLSIRQASEAVGLSYRHCRRSYKRFLEEGDAGLVHRRRGRPSNRTKPASFKKAVLARYRKRYLPHELGPTLAAEKLVQDGYRIDHETLRRWLIEAGLWKRRRKRRQHRTRRPRRERFGALVQLDGSHHHWFGVERDTACLMNMVDDATGRTLGLLDHQETTAASMVLLWRWIEKHGVPAALYTDKKNVFVTDREPTLEEQLAGETPKTAFGKACAKLGIEIITAQSPQAKGRVERSHGVYQERLVKELALGGITTIKTANKLLENGFCDQLNQKFAVAAIDKVDAHQPLPKGLQLEDVFCFEDTRVVQNDWTVRHQNRHYQIVKDNTPLPKPKDKVLMRTRLDGTVHVLYCDKPLKFERITPKQLAVRKQPPAPPKSEPPRKAKGLKPAPDHPWRNNCTLGRAQQSRTP